VSRETELMNSLEEFSPEFSGEPGVMEEALEGRGQEAGAMGPPGEQEAGSQQEAESLGRKELSPRGPG
jgi:hypothetical protein